MRLIAICLMMIGLAGCGGAGALPDEAVYDAPRSEVFDAVYSSNLARSREGLVSDMGARKIWRIRGPVSNFLDYDGDEEMELELRTRRPESAVYTTSMDGVDAEYKIRFTFEPIDDGERTRVTIERSAKGADADDPERIRPLENMALILSMELHTVLGRAF